MRSIVRDSKKKIQIRELALSIIRGLPGHKNWAGEVKRLHNFVQSRIQYVRDIRGVETVQTPEKTLEYAQGDCDDQSVLLASLLESIGHPTRFVAIAMSERGPYVHVFTETKIGPRWVPLETTEKWQAGQGPPRFAKRMVVYN